MNLKQVIMMVTVVAVAIGVEAAVSVTDVKAVQRYPWNGMVDIDYTVVCDDANADVYVFPEGTDNDTGALLLLKTLTGEGANGAVKAGTHRMTWNAAKDMPNFHSTSFSVKMTAISGAAPYIVIDLSGGANAASYPVRFSAAGPNLDDDTCRTTELWLRLILPGTFTMGSPETEKGRFSDEMQHEVTISSPFYIGVFEMTKKQYSLVTGKDDDVTYGGWPADNISYSDIRGSLVGANWPSHGQVDADSFLGKIRARTALNLDLPTEAQWEYACRAGTTTALCNGRDLEDANYQDSNLDKVGRYAYNSGVSEAGNSTTWDGLGGKKGVAKVGSYTPNAWGLYDMHGNVQEWCCDWFGTYPTKPEIDPKGVTNGTMRVNRGGAYCFRSRYCRSAFRVIYYSHGPGAYPSNVNGFRLCCSAD